MTSLKEPEKSWQRSIIEGAILPFLIVAVFALVGAAMGMGEHGGLIQNARRWALAGVFLALFLVLVGVLEIAVAILASKARWRDRLLMLLGYLMSWALIAGTIDFWAQNGDRETAPGGWPIQINLD